MHEGFKRGKVVSSGKLWAIVDICGSHLCEAFVSGLGSLKLEQVHANSDLVLFKFALCVSCSGTCLHCCHCGVNLL